MLKADKTIAHVNTAEMRKSILSPTQEKPAFKKKISGYNMKEVDAFIATLNTLLETTKSSFQSENEQMRNEVFILTKERDNHAKQIAEIKAGCDSQVAALTEELNRVRKQFEDARDRAAALQSTVSAQEELLKSKPDIDLLEQKLVECEQQLSQEKASNSFLSGKNEQLTASLESATTENTMLKSDISALRLSNKRRQASLEGSLFTYTRDLAEYLQDIKNHLSAVTVMADEIGSNAKKTDSLIRENFTKKPDKE